MAQVERDLELPEHLDPDVGPVLIGPVGKRSEVRRYGGKGESGHVDLGQSDPLHLVHAADAAAHADGEGQGSKLRMCFMIFLGNADRAAVAKVERGIDRGQAIKRDRNEVKRAFPLQLDLGRTGRCGKAVGGRQSHFVAIEINADDAVHEQLSPEDDRHRTADCLCDLA